MSRKIASIFALTSLIGCTDDFERYRYLGGPGIDLQPDTVATYVTNEQNVINQLLLIAGFSENLLSSSDDPRWKEVARAGINYVDVECARYIDSIYWYNRARGTISNQIGLAGAATTGIMGLAGTAAEAIAITALSFGLASASVDNIVNSVLYQLSPSAVHELLERAQSEYLGIFEQTNYNTPQGAMAAVRGYLALCLPASLETRVNEAVRSAEIDADVQRDPFGKPLDNSAPQVAFRDTLFSGNVTLSDLVASPIILSRALLSGDQVSENSLNNCISQAELSESITMEQFLEDGTGSFEVDRNIARCLIDEI